MSDAAEWLAAMKAKGHTPIVHEDGRLDFFVCDSGHHNGPGCSSCGWNCCWHCEGVDSIPECGARASPPTRRDEHGDLDR